MALADSTVVWHIVIDEDDKTMNNDAMIKYMDSLGLTYEISNCTNKIQACNYGVEALDWDIVILISDDMKCVAKGWDTKIKNWMGQFFPDLDGVLHFNDDRAKDGLNCLSCCGRTYYDRFGYIYNESYKSLWCDNEFTVVSKELGKVIYIDEVIIKHEWCIENNDLLMRKNESVGQLDKMIYELRKQKNFPIEVSRMTDGVSKEAFRKMQREKIRARREQKHKERLEARSNRNV